MDDEPRPATRPGLRIGSVLGIPVIISPTWLILAVVVTVLYADIVRQVLPGLEGGLVYAVSFGFVVTLCGSVFLHELGHALVSRYYRIRVRSITLEMLGGYTEMASDADKPSTEAAIALAGPATSAALGLIGLAGLAVFPPHTLAAQFAFQVAACNIIVAIYNVLPGLPLDGGRALRAAVWAIKGDKYVGSTVAGWAGRVVAALTIALCVFLYTVNGLSIIGVVFALLVAAVLWMGATRSIQMGTLGARFHLLDVATLMRRAAEIPTGTPLSEALRMAGETRAGGILVVDGRGEPVSLVHSAAAQAVPAERRPWMPVDDVATALNSTNTWDASWRGERVVAAMRSNPANEYAVVSDSGDRGIVRAADIADVLDPRVPASGEPSKGSPRQRSNSQED